MTTRVGAPERPPGHAVVEAGRVPSKRRVQKTLPVSLSMAKNRLPGPATDEIGVKMLTAGVTTPDVSDSAGRPAISSFDLHCSAKPGRLMLSSEMLMSFRTHDVCCASPYAVGQSFGLPRPWLERMAVSVTTAEPAMNSG